MGARHILSLLFLVTSSISAIVWIVEQQRVDTPVYRRVVSILDASRLARDVLGNDRAEFPIVFRVDRTGRLLSSIARRPVGFSLDSPELWKDVDHKAGNAQLASYMGPIIPVPKGQEGLVLLTLKGVCEPCDSVERDFIEFVEKHPGVDPAVVEAHVNI